jgi:hypothetical protein
LFPSFFVNLIHSRCALGFGVEFAAHFARAFMLAAGPRPDRAAAAVGEMGLPVLSGAATTFLGETPLQTNSHLFSSYEFKI